MILKTTYKSHFKLKNFLNKNSSKKIFVKNIIIFILFTKIFVNSSTTTFQFKKRNKNQISLLKAPSRHKKFFHQISYEYFYINIVIKFDGCVLRTITDNYNNTIILFYKLDNIFKNFGSNTLTRTVFKLRSINTIKPFVFRSTTSMKTN